MILSFIFTIFVYLEGAVIVTVIVTLPLFKNNIVGCYNHEYAYCLISMYLNMIRPIASNDIVFK